MSLKKTDLYKNQGLRIAEQMRKAAVPGRFGDQGEVLAPFQTRLPKSLIKVLQTQALARGLPVHELVTLALRAGLGGEVLAAAEAAVAPAPAVPTNAVAKKAAAKKASAVKVATKKPAAKKATVSKPVAKAPAPKAPAKKAVARKAASAQPVRKKVA